MSFTEIVKSIKPAVVGLGLLTDEKDPLSVDLIGTGFIVDPGGWIMTNRHVAEHFLAERDGAVGVSNAVARAVLFVDAAGRRIGNTGKVATGGFGAVALPIVEIAYSPSTQEDDLLHYDTLPDLAVCRINLENLNRFRLQQLPYLKLADSSSVREGEEVGSCGFPGGLTLTGDAHLRQFTAIIQKGIVAAVLPWPGIPNPHAFQLDMNINPGSSGSPLFRADNGEIVGIVFAACVQPRDVVIPSPKGQKRIATIALPTGFGYAVPSRRYHQRPESPSRLPDVYRT